MTKWRVLTAILAGAVWAVAAQDLPPKGGSHEVAAAWPGLWGPRRNGEAAAALEAPKGVREVWRRPTRGGYSEIAVAGGRAITTELRDGQDVVVALDAATGREQWSVRIAATYKGHDGSDDGPIGTPAIDGRDVFVTGPNGHLLAIDAETGRERWRHDLVREFDAELPGWGFGSSPLVEGNLVIVPTGGAKSRGLLAFARGDGRLAWSAPQHKQPAYSSAVLATIAGTTQVVVAAGDRVYAVTPEGRQLWSTPGPGGDVANSPIVLPGDRVLVSTWETAMLVGITRQAGGAMAPAELWRSTRVRAYNGPTIYRDGLLFAVVGPQLVCAEAATGEIRWRERTGEGTIVGFGRHLLWLGQSSGELRAVRVSPDGYAEAFRTRVFTPDITSVTGPSFANGRLYVRNLREMAAFDLR